MECGAKKKDGTPCRARAMPNGRCRIHGGKTPSGPAAPSFKHGRYSKYLPKGLATLYQEAQQDPDLLSIAGEIHLVDARLRELIARLETGECGATWKALREAAKAYRAATRAKDTEALGEAISEILRLIERGFGDWAAWREVGDQIDRRARLSAQEHRRLAELDQMIPAERAMVLVSALAEVVRRNVSDRDTLSRITGEFREILSRSTGGSDLSEQPAPDQRVIDVG